MGRGRARTREERAVATTDLSCKEIVELVTEYLEDVLPEVTREAFERHLAGCDGCLSYLDQMRDTIRLAGELPIASLPPALQEELLVAFRGWSARS
jgi:hypothetical protein